MKYSFGISLVHFYDEMLSVVVSLYGIRLLHLTVKHMPLVLESFTTIDRIYSWVLVVEDEVLLELPRQIPVLNPSELMPSIPYI